jgi:hypothetical protein
MVTISKIARTRQQSRWIASHPWTEEDPPVTLLGDDLYCNQPICETVLEHGYHFIFVCKRSSHPELYDWVDYLERVGEELHYNQKAP